MTAIDRSAIESEIKKVVALLFKVDEAKVTRETRFIEDLYAKSIQIVEMCALMEYKFEIEIPMKEVRNNKTVGEAIEYIAGKLSQDSRLAA